MSNGAPIRGHRYSGRHYDDPKSPELCSRCQGRMVQLRDKPTVSMKSMINCTKSKTIQERVWKCEDCGYEYKIDDENFCNFQDVTAKKNKPQSYEYAVY